MLAKIEEKITALTTEPKSIEVDQTPFTLEEITWMVKILKQQKEEIHHLKVLRTSVHYEERRASERALRQIAQTKDDERKPK